MLVPFLHSGLTGCMGEAERICPQAKLRQAGAESFDKLRSRAYSESSTEGRHAGADCPPWWTALPMSCAVYLKRVTCKLQWDVDSVLEKS